MSIRSFFIAVAIMNLSLNALAAVGAATFNYQARVLVQGIPYTGTGQVKVAILANSADTTATVWSNDGTSLAASEPAGSFTVNVSGGLFDFEVGNDALGMQVIPAIMFNRGDTLKVRVWFNDGSHGFQQLSPDRSLNNPRRLGIDEIRTSTTLYVNATTGNDLNSGLSPSTAKKTIQAAVDMVPARVLNNMTVLIAPGVYREQVSISGISALKQDQFMVMGDTTTVPSDTVSPSVRITGTDNDATHAKVRDYGMTIFACHNVGVSGILVDYCNTFGFWGYNSLALGYRCKATNCSRGYHATGTGFELRYSWACNNGSGFATDAGHLGMVECGAADNTGQGVVITNGGVALYGPNYIKRNPIGVLIQMNSFGYLNNTTYVQNNTTYGVQIIKDSMVNGIGLFSYSGNGTNSIITDSKTY